MLWWGEGGGGVSLSTCSQGAPSHQKLTSRAGASASAPKQDGKVPGHPHPQKSSGAGSSISPTRQQGNNHHLLWGILLCIMKNIFKCTWKYSHLICTFLGSGFHSGQFMPAMSQHKDWGILRRSWFQGTWGSFLSLCLLYTPPWIRTKGKQNHTGSYCAELRQEYNKRIAEKQHTHICM